jgi:RNA polymerase sigma factor (sigma-70 family)
MHITDKTNVKDLTLNDYTVLARKFTGHFAKKMGIAHLIDDECVGNVAHNIMIAAHKWKPNKGKGLYNYIGVHAEFAVKSWIRDRRRYERNVLYLEANGPSDTIVCDKHGKPHSVVHEIIRDEFVDMIINDTRQLLNERERNAFELVIMDDMSYTQAGKQLGLSCQTVQNNVRAAIRKLRQAHHEMVQESL